MKIILAVLFLIFSPPAFAVQIQRELVPSVDNLALDTFLYLPDDLANAKGVVLAIGGSGLTKAGIGGPSRFSREFAANGFIGVEWNKRGIVTSQSVDSTQIEFETYNSTTIENIFLDAAKVLEFTKARFPKLPVFVVGGSEGSVTTTLLAEYYGQDLKAVATFGNVVMPFVQTSSMQITDLFLKESWNKLDSNSDKSVSATEFANFRSEDSDFDFLARADFSKVDLTGDGAVSFEEMSAYIVDYFVNGHPNQNFWYDSSGVAGRYLESMFRLPPLTFRAYSISIPVFMAQGEDDWNTPAKNVYEFQIQCKATKKKNFTFKYYPKVGHAPSPEMFADILAYFLSHTINPVP